MSYFLKVFVISMMTTHVLITRAMISDPQTQTQNLNQPQTASLPPSPLNPKGDAGLSSYQLGSHQPVFSKLEPNKTVNCRYEYALYYSQAQDGTSIPYVRCMDNDYSIWDCPQNTCRGMGSAEGCGPKAVTLDCLAFWPSTTEAERSTCYSTNNELMNCKGLTGWVLDCLGCGSLDPEARIWGKKLSEYPQ